MRRMRTCLLVLQTWRVVSGAQEYGIQLTTNAGIQQCVGGDARTLLVGGCSHVSLSEFAMLCCQKGAYLVLLTSKFVPSCGYIIVRVFKTSDCVHVFIHRKLSVL
jgi:hypothetical protein